MSEHERITCFQVCKLVIHITWHLVDHGTFQMHYLVMGQYQNIILTARITHGKGHLIMIIFPEIRVKLHIFQEIVHPAHIPLEGKSKTVIFNILRNTRPCSGFLRNYHCSVISSTDEGIQMFKEPDGLQIFLAAIFVRHPLTVLFSIIQIQHGCHRIHTKTIYMIFIEPEQRIGNQEIPYL